jgi:tetrathionate reductase subunit A
MSEETLGQEGMNNGVSRRTFLQALGGASALAASGISITGCGPQAKEKAKAPQKLPASSIGGKPIEAYVDPQTGGLTINEDVLVRYSSCLGCYCTCGISVRIDRGTGQMFGVGGNPYNPNNAYPYLDFDQPLSEAYLVRSQAYGKQAQRGSLCGRGNATFDAYSQPDRITTPLKRAGKRGEGKWKPISWDQLIEEVCEGGQLFKEIGEDTVIEGFKALHDNTTPLDPDSPELGPVSNGVCLLGGRGDGRGWFSSRFVASYGTVNQYGHGSSCGGAKNVNVYNSGSRDLRTDIPHAEYILWIGLFPGANGKSMQGIALQCAGELAKGKVKMDVVDPVLGNGIVTPAMKNVRWIPIRAATNTAFAMGMLQWIVDNKAYNDQYLALPNYQAALEAGFASYTNATHLVISDPAHPNYRKLLRADEAGVQAPAPKDPAKPEDAFVVIDKATGQPGAHKATSSAVLEYEGEVNGIAVRTAFLYQKDAIYELGLDEYAAICEVDPQTIIDIAREFTSHGTRASATGMGSTATINGLDSACIYTVLDAMIGSDLMKGGMVPRRSSAKTMANGERYLLSDNPDAPKKAGIAISRTSFDYTKTSEYKRKLAAGQDIKPLLPWYPLPGVADNQAIVSIANAYPYQTKILLNWMVNTLQATPGAMRKSIIDKLKDPAVVPLVITCDVVMGEHASLSDYIVPDTTPFESWGVGTQEGYFNGKGNTVRWPVIAPGSIAIPGGRHANYEAFICDVAEKCGLPGFGEDAVKAVDGSTWGFHDAADVYIKGVANLAWDTVPVEDVTEEEARLQGLDGLPRAWKDALAPEEWPKVLKVLSRGGRYWPVEEAYDEKGRSAYGTDYMINIYHEKRAMATNSYSLTKGSGFMRWLPESFSDWTPLEGRYPRQEWPFAAVNYKPRFRSISLLANSPLMRDICPSNFIEMNAEDAEGLGILDGQPVKVLNPTGDVMQAAAMVRGGVAKGNFGLAHGYGHFAYGAQDYEVEGTVVKGNPEIAAGANITMMLDPTVEGIFPMADPEAGTPGRCGGVFKIAKA